MNGPEGSVGQVELVSSGRTEQERARWWPSERLVAVAVVVLVAVAGVSYHVGTTKAPRPSPIRVPVAGKPVVIPIPGDSPTGAGYAFGSLWVMQVDGHVVRVDPATNAVGVSIPVGQQPLAARAGFGSVWVSNGGDGTVSRIDPVSNQVVATIPVGPLPYEIAPAGGGMWLSTQKEVERINPSTNLVDLRVPIPLPPGTQAQDTSGLGLDADERGVWVSTPVGTVLHLRPTDGHLVATIRVLPDNHTQPGAVAIDGDQVWVSNYPVTGPGVGTARYGAGIGVTVLSAAFDEIVERVSAGGYPVSGLLPHNGTVYMVGNQLEKRSAVLMRADWPYQILAWVRAVGGRSFDVVAAAGSLWVPSFDDNALYRLPL